MIAWADNWQYRFDIPTSPFNGQLTVVRELELRCYPEGIRLVHTPVRELESLRQQPVTLVPTTITPNSTALLDLGYSYDVLVEFDSSTATAREFGIDVRVGEGGEYTRVGYDTTRGVAYIDRRRSGLNPHPQFAGRHEAPASPLGGRIHFRVLVDRSSIEVFVNGREQLTDLILPSSHSRECRLFTVDGEVALTRFTAWPLDTIWQPPPRPSALSISGEWAWSEQGLVGSATTQGLAIVPAPAPAAIGVTILGTKEGNPGRILGETSAGLVVHCDERAEAGLALVLDRQHQRLRVRPLGTSHDVASTTFPVQTNRIYQVATTRHGTQLTVEIDGHPVLTVDVAIPSATDRTALMVNNAEALFDWATS